LNDRRDELPFQFDGSLESWGSPGGARIKTATSGFQHDTVVKTHAREPRRSPAMREDLPEIYSELSSFNIAVL
jgi:hypothetical protein